MPRRSREIWRNLIGQLERSGKKVEEFAAEREIPVSTLRQWVYRIRREKREQEGSILPVRVVGSASPSEARRSDNTTGAAVEVMLVRFPSDATNDFIADVVTRLRRC
jgi:hypothetical protein